MKHFIALLAGLTAVAGVMLAGPAAAAPFRTPFFVGYFQSWSDRSGPAEKTQLAHVAGYVSVVVLGFMRPDAVYSGDDALGATGLSFGYSGRTLRRAIALLHERHPGTRILVGVGSPAYPRWNRLDAAAIGRFVRDFGLDGVDIDFEVKDPGCDVRADGDIACRTDREIAGAVMALRKALPRPLLLALAVPHVGAYYPRRWRREMPGHSPYAGMFRQPLSIPGVRRAIDFLDLMAYDAGTGFHPLAAVAAYRELFAGPIALGVEPPPEYWGDHAYTLAGVAALAAAVRRERIGGMMLYSLQKPPSGRPGWPDSRAMARQICISLALGGCAAPLY